jgi:hypothetical protein
MFDMFKKKPSNVVPFPEQEETEYGAGDYGVVKKDIFKQTYDTSNAV